MKNIFDIEGKVALVTGSTGALGSTFARGLAAHGATVILNGRNKQKLDQKVSLLNSEGLKAFGYVFDVTNSEQVNEAISKIEEELGPSIYWSTMPEQTFVLHLEDFKDEDWNTVIGINLTGAYLVAKAVCSIND